MNKELALKKVQEAEQALEEAKKLLEEVEPEDVIVYVKKWKERPFDWNPYGGMDYLKGTLQTLNGKGLCGKYLVKSLHGENVGEWNLSTKDFIVVEGSLDSL
jgi:hypothetical protein